MLLMGSALAALLAGALLHRLRVPSGALIGAVLGAAVYRAAVGGMAVTPPQGFRFAAFLVIGWQIGQGFDREALRNLRAARALMTGTVAWLFALALAVAAGLTGSGTVDGVTAVLATLPGGLSHMAALAVDLDADVAFVLGFHFTRLLLVLLVTPLLLAIAAGRRRT